jgi:hypothetical protein
LHAELRSFDQRGTFLESPEGGDQFGTALY